MCSVFHLKENFFLCVFFLIVFFVPVVCLCHKERGISKKNRPEKILFHRNKELNCISCSVVCKTTFRSEFPGIPDKPDRVTRRRTQAIAKRLVFHANAKRDFGTFIFLWIYEIFKNTYFYRWLVAGSIVLLVVSFELFFCKRFTFLVLWLQVKIFFD